MKKKLTVLVLLVTLIATLSSLKLSNASAFPSITRLEGQTWYDTAINIYGRTAVVPNSVVSDLDSAIIKSEGSEYNKIYGIDFGPFKDGQDPNIGSVVSEEQFKERLSILSPYVNWIRTYGSADGGLANAGKIAHGFNIKIAQGCWLSKDKTANNIEIENLVNAAKAGDVDIAIVGSETLYRGDLDENELVEYINKVKKELPSNVLVTTSDVNEQWLKHPKVIEAVDVILVNYYPIYQGIVIADCISALDTMHKALLSSVQGKEIIVSETGFASEGSRRINAVPSPENAAKYFADFIEWSNNNNVKYFYFEAFDEAWKNSLKFKSFAPQAKLTKGSEVGTVKITNVSEQCQYRLNNQDWQCCGGADVDNLKAVQGNLIDLRFPEDDYHDTSAVQTLEVSRSVIKKSDTPIVKLINIPKKGDSSALKGQVDGLEVYGEYRIVLYILVDGHYWIKPYANSPLTLINDTGEFTVSYNTGGNDINTTEFGVFLVKKGYSPPVILGASTLPVELYKNALASVIGMR